MFFDVVPAREDVVGASGPPFSTGHIFYTPLEPPDLVNQTFTCGWFTRSRTPVLLVLTLENRESQTHHLCQHSTPTYRYVLQETLSLSSHTGILRSSGAASFVTTVAFTIRFFAFQISEQVPHIQSGIHASSTQNRNQAQNPTSARDQISGPP
jgi:hypothetical protein